MDYLFNETLSRWSFNTPDALLWRRICPLSIIPDQLYIPHRSQQQLKKKMLLLINWMLGNDLFPCLWYFYSFFEHSASQTMCTLLCMSRLCSLTLRDGWSWPASLVQSPVCSKQPLCSFREQWQTPGQVLGSGVWSITASFPKGGKSMPKVHDYLLGPACQVEGLEGDLQWYLGP